VAIRSCDAGRAMPRSLGNASGNHTQAAWSGLCGAAPASKFSNGCQLLLVYTEGLGEDGPPVAQIPLHS
jgi:hypothetical protein